MQKNSQTGPASLNNGGPFLAQVQKFYPIMPKKLRLRYTPGFDTEAGLAITLANRLASDIELGYTRMGCHRADINVVLDLGAYRCSRA